MTARIAEIAAIAVSVVGTGIVSANDATTTGPPRRRRRPTKNRFNAKRRRKNPGATWLVEVMMDAPECVRIDKWLWAVRLYKSRAMAVAACAQGRVRINEAPVKPSRNVRAGDIIIALTGGVLRTVRVRAVLERRVGAKQVGGFLEDLTPPEALAGESEPWLRPLFTRPKGSGRPTKKERRSFEEYFGG